MTKSVTYVRLNDWSKQDISTLYFALEKINKDWEFEIPRERIQLKDVVPNE